MPPRGGKVERDRMSFYFDRAAKTRLQDGKEKMPTKQQYQEYLRAMKKLFDQRAPPVRIDYADVFDSNSNLRVDVFDRALTHIDQTSTPGFPFLNYEINADVPRDKLYSLVNDTLKRWDAFDLKGVNFTFDDFVKIGKRFTKTEWFLNGMNWPAKCFVKGEPTDTSKVARLIYGLSIVMNVISVIFYGDYLRKLPESWSEASHKVGIDFTSDLGLAKVTSSYEMLLAASRLRKMEVFSDDIQGWEYQSRSWMLFAWHLTYSSYQFLTNFQRKMDFIYALMETVTLVVDSDGIIHDLPFYITFSGKRTTHAENSDTRGALREVDGSTVEPVRRQNKIVDPRSYKDGSENGDDSLGLCGDTKFSESLGFVHTDKVLCTNTRFPFCSNVFFRERVGQNFRRKPENYQKLLFNYLATSDITAKFAIVLEFKDSEYFPIFESMLIKDLYKDVR